MLFCDTAVNLAHAAANIVGSRHSRPCVGWGQMREALIDGGVAGLTFPLFLGMLAGVSSQYVMSQGEDFCDGVENLYAVNAGLSQCTRL